MTILTGAVSFDYLYVMRSLIIFLLSWGIFQGPLIAQKLRKSKLEKIIASQPGFQGAQVAVAVQRLGESKLRAQRQESHYMTPASNTKLLTFLAVHSQLPALPVLTYALDSLQQTHFQATGYPVLLHPFYPDDQALSFLNTQNQLIYHRAVQQIPRLGPGWSWDDFSYYYSAPPSAFPIYGNVTQLIRTETNSLEVTPTFPTRPVTDAPFAAKRMEFENQFTFNPEKIALRDSLYRPFLPSDSLFAQLLGEAIGQKVTYVEKPYVGAMDTLFVNDPKTIYQALLQDSDNLVAESLMLMVGQKLTDTLSVNKGVAAMQTKWASWLPDPLEWVDGSGVSRYNMATPRTLVAVLQKIHQQLGLTGIASYFPQGGQSGTLKAYNFGPGLTVYAKTGTLRHNHNLSGYFQGKKGHWYAFSVMVNHYTAPTAEIRQGIAAILKACYAKL